MGLYKPPGQGASIFAVLGYNRPLMAVKHLPDCVKVATLAVATEFARVMTTPLTADRQRYLTEVLAVTRAAAIGGEYRDALKGYEVIGRMLGHVSEAPQQHLHLHANGAPLADKTDAELVALMLARPDPAPHQAESCATMDAEVEAAGLLYA